MKARRTHMKQEGKDQGRTVKMRMMTEDKEESDVTISNSLINTIYYILLLTNLISLNKIIISTNILLQRYY